MTKRLIGFMDSTRTAQKALEPEVNQDRCFHITNVEIKISSRPGSTR